jgi:prophage antirepressor-like protein
MEIKNIILSYETEAGATTIRTINRGDEVLFSLVDVTMVLYAQNQHYAENGKKIGFMGFVKAQVEALESDEKEVIASTDAAASDLSHNIYVTQPGLLRVISRDKSPACRKFQRWVFHEVLPCIIKHGTYPPPIERESDLKRLTKILLGEIEERERLEQETKKRFTETDKKLISLSERVQQIESTRIGSEEVSEYHTIEDYCRHMSFSDGRLQHIFGWCLKICAEEGIPSKKAHPTDYKWPSKFPEYVITKAIDLTAISDRHSPDETQSSLND